MTLERFIISRETNGFNSIHFNAFILTAIRLLPISVSPDHYPCSLEICSLWSAQTAASSTASTFARSGSSTSITSSSVGCLSFLISHHLISPFVDAERNSVLVLDVIQSAWFVEIFCASSEEMGKRSVSVTEITIWQRNGRLFGKRFAATTIAEIATAFTKRKSRGDP